MSKEMIETPEAAVASIGLLAEYLTDDSLAKAKRDLECGGTIEVVLMAAMFYGLHQTTEEHTKELSADGFVLRCEEAQQRAGNYYAAYEELIERFG